eukprot:8944229-Pyramimonas_sp.AAC.1
MPHASIQDPRCGPSVRGLVANGQAHWRKRRYCESLRSVGNDPESDGGAADHPREQPQVQEG